MQQKPNQAHWLVASLADAKHKHINFSVNSTILLMDLFEDKAFFYGWEQLTTIPPSSDGLFGPTSITLLKGEPAMLVNIAIQANVLKQWTSVSLLVCQQYAH